MKSSSHGRAEVLFLKHLAKLAMKVLNVFLVAKRYNVLRGVPLRF